jgi:14-3-3 protein epsilon
MASRTYDESIYLARVAEQCERFEDMIDFLDCLGTKNEDLTTEERNLISVAFKNSVGLRRTAWRAVSSIAQKPKYADYSDACKKYMGKIEGELDDLCTRINELIDGKFMKNCANPESKVFFHKMKADYYRYLSEVVSGDKLKAVTDLALKAYENANNDSSGLSTAHPIKLGLALNFSVFYYEAMNNHKKACELAKAAFDEAINNLDNLDEDQYKDAATIMQLLRDNLTLWTAEQEDEKDNDNVIDL